jgi:gamma-glutamyl phosphate reductase
MTNSTHFSSDDAVRQHVEDKARQARKAARALRTVSSAVKDAALLSMADALPQRQDELFAPTKRT